MSHQVDALVISCIDYRLRPIINGGFLQTLGIKTADLKTDAGGVMKLLEGGPVADWVIMNIAIAVEKHGIKRLVLVNHEDCAAYASRGVFNSHDEESRFHIHELEQAAAMLKHKFPQLSVEAYYARLADNSTGSTSCPCPRIGLSCWRTFLISVKSNLYLTGKDIVREFKSNGFDAFFVGGYVRNMLLNLTSDNLDIATSAHPTETERILRRLKVKYKSIGKKFGTIMAITNAGVVEITTFRTEGEYKDKRRPHSVSYHKDLVADSTRRDFTINAFYYDPLTKQLFDPQSGLTDLKNKTLNFIGKQSNRVKEDPLRLMRAVRLATMLGFEISTPAKTAVKSHAKLITHISAERITNELHKILLHTNRTRGVLLLENLKLLKAIFPKLALLRSVTHNSKFYHLEGDVLAHSLLVADSLKYPDLETVYAALFHDSGKLHTGKKVVKNGEQVLSFKGHPVQSQKIFSKFAKAYKLPRLMQEHVKWLIAEHDHKFDFLSKLSDAQRVKFASHPLFSKLLDLWQADILGNKISKENQWYRNSRLKSVLFGTRLLKKISAKHELITYYSSGNLIKQILPKINGPEIGKLQDEIKAEVVYGRIKNKNQLKKFLKTKKLLDNASKIV